MCLAGFFCCRVALERTGTCDVAMCNRCMFFWQEHGVCRPKDNNGESFGDGRKRSSSRVKTACITTKAPMRKSADDDGVGDCDHDSPDGYQRDEYKCYFQDSWRNWKAGQGREKQMSMKCIDCEEPIMKL